MSYLYVDETGSKLGIEGGRIIVKTEKGTERSLPLETLEGVILLNKSQLSTQCIEKLLIKGIPVSFFSKGGKYFGRLMSTGHTKPELQRKQCSLYDSPFALKLAQRIIDAKLRNQLVVLRRYAKNDNIDIDENIKYIRLEIKDIFNTQSVSELNGREGIAAKYYFAGLSKCIDSDFSFQGRNRRPPKDPFNSMIKLTKKQYNKLLSVIPRFCGDKDSIRVYKLTGKCQITCWGVKDVTDEDEIVIV